MDDAAMRWGDGNIAPSHRPTASPHRPSHRLIVHRIASSSIASPHRPSHRLIVHRIASSSIASPQRQCEPSRPSYTIVQQSWTNNGLVEHDLHFRCYVLVTDPSLSATLLTLCSTYFAGLMNCSFNISDSYCHPRCWSQWSGRHY